jgi:uncharacterized membrane protein
VAAGRIRHQLQLEGKRVPISPALLAHERKRANYVQNRVADGITDFAGSMVFVYVHILWFVLWISLPVEAYPFGLLTMIVSLEAIFLSTFVMISQNRADQRRQVFANEQYVMIEEEKKQNELMIEQNKRIEELDKAILALTQEVRKALRS